MIRRMLVIGAVWPEPGSSAAGAHLLQVLAPFLADGWQIDFAATAGDASNACDLTGMGITPHTVEVNAASFDDLLTSMMPDVVLFDRFFIEEQFGWRVEENCPDALRILNTEDLHSLRETRRLEHLATQTSSASDSSANAAAPLTSTAIAPAQSSIARREIASLLRSDLSLIISEAELAFLEDVFSIDPELLHYAPFMLDLPDAKSREFWAPFSERRDFVCIGNFRHAPNWDAIRWMAEAIWPRIRKERPEANLRIAGAYPTDQQLALHSPETGLHIEGRIQDADVAFGSARVCLAPMRFGAGLKGKLFDAMRCGTPSITTRIGAEGIAGDLPFGGLIADDVDALVEGALRLYDNETLWHEAQTQGLAILRERFDRRVHEAALMDAVHRSLIDLTRRRDQNFMGAMLRDHQHKSTRYLSLWIEAKNKLADVTAGAPTGEQSDGVESPESESQNRLPTTKKLPGSKWSAARPRNKEKHFVITRVLRPKNAREEAPRVELEALLSKRRLEIPLDELSDVSRWRKGWT